MKNLIFFILFISSLGFADSFNIPSNSGGGVTPNSCSSGEFANGIGSDGTLSCSMPSGGGVNVGSPVGDQTTTGGVFYGDGTSLQQDISTLDGAGNLKTNSVTFISAGSPGVVFNGGATITDDGEGGLYLNGTAGTVAVSNAGGITANSVLTVGTGFVGDGSGLTGYSSSFEVATATYASSATSADSCNYATFAENAGSANYANNAGSATSAGVAQNFDNVYDVSIITSGTMSFEGSTVSGDEFGGLGLFNANGSGLYISPGAGDGQFPNNLSVSNQLTVSGQTLFGDAINNNIDQTTLAGTTSGQIVYSMPFKGSSYKKVVISFQSFVSTGSTITFPTAFIRTPYVYGTTAAAAISSASTTTFTFGTASNITGMVFVEGY